MGSFLEKPKTDKITESGSGNGLRYGLCSMQGYRVEMEDAHIAVPELPGALKLWSYFGVFDGHAGARVSQLCSERLLDFILATPEFKSVDATQPIDVDKMKLGIVNGFLNFDRDLERENSNERSGSTAVVSFVTPTHIFIGNCGDSRALLVRSSEVVLGTEDHKPYLPNETKRITNAGGQVVLYRVNGSLAVSRSLGDFEYKKVEGKSAIEQLVSPEPDILVIERSKEQDQLLILACDGLWDVFPNKDLVEYVLQRLKCVVDLDIVSSELIDTALHKGSRDNMSVLLVALDKAPSLNREIQMKDKALDQSIESIVKDVLTNTPGDIDITVEYVTKMVEAKELPDYPPGGVIAKKGLIDSYITNFQGGRFE